MTAPAAAGPQGLLGKLMAAVRVEFRGETLVFDPDDPVFGGGPCRVSGCERNASGHGLCLNHRVQWAKQGRPDLESSPRGPIRGRGGGGRTSNAR